MAMRKARLGIRDSKILADILTRCYYVPPAATMDGVALLIYSPKRGDIPYEQMDKLESLLQVSGHTLKPVEKQIHYENCHSNTLRLESDSQAFEREWGAHFQLESSLLPLMPTSQKIRPHNKLLAEILRKCTFIPNKQYIPNDLFNSGKRRIEGRITASWEDDGYKGSKLSPYGVVDSPVFRFKTNEDAGILAQELWKEGYKLYSRPNNGSYDIGIAEEPIGRCSPEAIAKKETMQQMLVRFLSEYGSTLKLEDTLSQSLKNLADAKARASARRK